MRSILRAHKHFLILAASLLASSCPPPMDLCVPDQCVYLFPSNCCTQNAYCFLDFLYWEGTERGLEFALKNRTSFFDQNIEIYEPNFGFGPAMRLGIGTHLPHDNWDLEFAFTRYYTHTRNHAHHNFLGNPQGGIRSVWTSSIAFQENGFSSLWQDVEAKWNFHANLFDLFLKNRLRLSSALNFEPTLGLKLALLQQRYKVIYQNGNSLPNIQDAALIQFISSTIAMKNRSLNLGPSASLATRWDIFPHVDLIASLSGSLLASRFTIGRNEFDTSQSGSFQVDSLRENTTYWTVRPQAKAALGLEWSDCLDRKQRRISYGLSASYEAQVFWKQNMLLRFIDQTNGAMIAATQGDLFFHGLTLDIFIDF